jgi:antitoxin (DNA-binding transcriptional repressor) of toxin-antitoxin stability system
MRTMTATEASRHFSDLLDLIESGETVRISRGNELIAEISPVRRRTGADLEAALLAAGLSPLDDDFENDIAETMALATTTDEDDPWAET